MRRSGAGGAVWAEARAALPIEGEASPEAVFAGLERRRLRVRQGQGAPEWTPT